MSHNFPWSTFRIFPRIHHFCGMLWIAEGVLNRFARSRISRWRLLSPCAINRDRSTVTIRFVGFLFSASPFVCSSHEPSKCLSCLSCVVLFLVFCLLCCWFVCFVLLVVVAFPRLLFFHMCLYAEAADLRDRSPSQRGMQRACAANMHQSSAKFSCI